MVKRIENVEGLHLSIQDQEIGILTHYSGGKNILAFSPDYVALPTSQKPTFTITQIAKKDYLSQPLVNAQRLAPVLSNLLPEGALRDWMAQSLTIDKEDEFPLFAHMGQNLPGAIVANIIAAGEVPAWALDHREQVEAIQIDIQNKQDKFSLAGVQMKFSSARNKDGRFNIGQHSDDDSWIIKTPSTVHRHVPYNEFSMMTLAKAVGVDIPQIKLVPLNKLHNIPNIQLPNEEYAYAIKRFDREGGKRIHTEDFAQVFGLYPQDKYKKINYEQIANVLYQHSRQGLKDVQQLARRLLVNILLANGDAHLKNWSLIYHDGKQPQLSPAYDIVSTLPYVENEQAFALNMAKNKYWYQVDLNSFKTWAERIGVSWPAIKVHLEDVLSIAKEQWPAMLQELPLIEQHKKILKAHWGQLDSSLRL